MAGPTCVAFQTVEALPALFPHSAVSCLLLGVVCPCQVLLCAARGDTGNAAGVTKPPARSKLQPQGHRRGGAAKISSPYMP